MSHYCHTHTAASLQLPSHHCAHTTRSNPQQHHHYQQQPNNLLGKELEHLGGLVAVQSTLELVDRGRHLQALLQDLLLALHAHVARPAHEAAEVALGLRVVQGERVREREQGLVA